MAWTVEIGRNPSANDGRTPAEQLDPVRARATPEARPFRLCQADPCSAQVRTSLAHSKVALSIAALVPQSTVLVPSYGTEI